MLFVRQDIVSEADVASFQMADIAFHGAADTDDRSHHSCCIAKSAGRSHHSVAYHPSRYLLEISGSFYRVDALEELAFTLPASRIVIDATTLDFPEILLLLHAYSCASLRPSVAFCYVEPEEYVRKPDGLATEGAAFDLSDAFGTKNVMPLYSSILTERSKAHLVSFLGFEGSRLSRVLAEDDGHFYNAVTAVFGVPPFRTPWDMESLAANSRLLDEPSVEVQFCAASSPFGAYCLLRDLYKGLQARGANKLAVAPFGTKPMAIGAALFCVECMGVRVVYDFPVRKKGRTRGIGLLHWYEAELD